MAPPPPSDTIDFPPSRIVQGTPTHTAHDPNVAVHTLLGTVVDQYMPSKPTTLATAVASK
eukprot:scaffold39616_cov59-Attheya_sp.AAC.1